MKPTTSVALQSAIEQLRVLGFTCNFSLDGCKLLHPTVPQVTYSLSNVSLSVQSFPDIGVNLYMVTTKDDLYRGYFTSNIPSNDDF